MSRLRAAAVGFAAAIVLAAISLGALAAIESRQKRGVSGAAAPAASARPTERLSPAVSPAASSTAAPVSTRDDLLRLQASGTPATSQKARILELALAEFTRQNRSDLQALRRQVSLLAPADYNGKSASGCEDGGDIRSAAEAWLLDVRQDALYVNDGFSPAGPQSVTDLFFRYAIGLYNVAPRLKSYPSGVTSSDGTTAFYEKGLILLGKRGVDQLLQRDCYLQYRKPQQEGFTADQALKLLDRIGLAPAPEYAYPQKRSLEAWRSGVAPKIGSAALLDPFLQTDSGELYRRVGRALNGSSGSDASATAAADALFRSVFGGQ